MSLKLGDIMCTQENFSFVRILHPFRNFKAQSDLGIDILVA